MHLELEDRAEKAIEQCRTKVNEAIARFERMLAHDDRHATAPASHVSSPITEMEMADLENYEYYSHYVARPIVL